MLDSNFLDSTKKLKELKIIENINKNPQQTQQELAENINISKGMINRYLKDLISRDLIKELKSKKQLTTSGKKYFHNLRLDYYQELLILDKDLKNEISKYGSLIKNKVKIAAIKSAGSFLPQLVYDLNIIDNYPFDLDITYFANGYELMEHFQSEKFDLGFLGVVPAFLWKSTGAKIEIIAEANRGGHAVIARKEISSIKDLNNKTVLVPRKNESVSDNLLKKLVRETNIKINRVEFKDLNLSVDDLKNKFNELEQIDALLLWEPYLSQILNFYPELKLIHKFEADQYTSNVMIIPENNNLDKIHLDLIEEMFKEAAENIVIENKKVLSSMSNFFKMEKDIIKHSLKRIEFNYQKWEE